MNLSLSGSKNLRKVHFYGHAIPYLEGIEIKGKFIVIEGPDNSGRICRLNYFQISLRLMVMPL